MEGEKLKDIIKFGVGNKYKMGKKWKFHKWKTIDLYITKTMCYQITYKYLKSYLLERKFMKSFKEDLSKQYNSTDFDYSKYYRCLYRDKIWIQRKYMKKYQLCKYSLNTFSVILTTCVKA